MESGYGTSGSHSRKVQDVFEEAYFVTGAKWGAIVDGKLEYDFVVIGSGMCGSAAVDRVLEKNRMLRVLMLEGGDIFLTHHFKSHNSTLVHVKGGPSETFPWTMSNDSSTGKLGTVTKQHGMVPFFGGRSTVWNAWCPRPTKQELSNWPRETVERLNNTYFGEAEAFLNVQSVDNAKQDRDGGAANTNNDQPRRVTLQSIVHGRLSGAEESTKIWDRVEPARIARASKNSDVGKFSTPSVLLELVRRQREMHKATTGAEFDIKCSCVVERIIFDDDTGTATHLQTSRGKIPLRKAVLIIAGGTLPTTTLVRNSLPPRLVRKRFNERLTAQFVTAVTARIPIYDELAECRHDASDHYIPGWTKSGMQFHIQLSGRIDQRSEVHKMNTDCRIPTILAKAMPDSLKGYIVYKLCALGQMNDQNEGSWFKENEADPDKTTNSILQMQSNSATDEETWDTMDQGLFGIFDMVKNDTNNQIQFMTKTTPDGEDCVWSDEKPSKEKRRKTTSVHESSTLYIGVNDDDPVDLDYRLRGTSNVYITGGALWPSGGAWNPVLTMVAMAIDLVDRLVERRHRLEMMPSNN